MRQMWSRHASKSQPGYYYWFNPLTNQSIWEESALVGPDAHHTTDGVASERSGGHPSVGSKRAREDEDETPGGKSKGKEKKGEKADASHVTDSEKGGKGDHACQTRLALVPFTPPGAPPTEFLEPEEDDNDYTKL